MKRAVIAGRLSVCRSWRRGQAAVERRIKEIAEARVRYGYRRVQVLPGRQAWVLNMEIDPKDLHWSWACNSGKAPEEARERELRDDCQKATGPTDVLAMDLLRHQLAIGEKLRILTDCHALSRWRS